MNQSVTTNRPLCQFMMELLQERTKDSYLIVDDNARLQQKQYKMAMLFKQGDLKRDTSETSVETTRSLPTCTSDHHDTYSCSPEPTGSTRGPNTAALVWR